MLKKLIIFSFIIFLSSPIIIKLSFPNLKLVNLNEKRKTNENLDLKNSKILEVPSRIDTYWQDNFGFRNLFIKTSNSIKFHIFNNSPTEKVLIGKSNWLFYGNTASKLFFERKDLYSKNELRKLYLHYNKRINKLRKLGVNYMLVITPSKASVYPEMYNDKFLNKKNKNRIEHFISYAKKQNNLPIFYLKKTLFEAKKYAKIPLYIKTDSHWNSFGAYYAYKKIIELLKTQFRYNLEPLSLNKYKTTIKQRKGGFGRMLGVFNPPKSNIYLIKNLEEDKAFNASRDKRAKLIEKTKNHKLPLIIKRRVNYLDHDNFHNKTVLVYRNSFFKRILPFFSKHFSKSIYYSNLYNDFSMKHLELHKPDLIIEQFTDFQFS